MFAAVRYNQKFIGLKREHYDACPDFGQVYLETVAKSKAGLGAETEASERRPHRLGAKKGARSTLNREAAAGADSKESSRRAAIAGEGLASPRAVTKVGPCPKADEPTKSKKVSSRRDFFIWKDLLYLRDPVLGLERLCIPNHEGPDGESTLRQRLISEIHDGVMAVHLGAARTTQELKKRAYWPGMDVDVRDHIRQCESCQRNKAQTQKPTIKTLRR